MGNFRSQGSHEGSSGGSRFGSRPSGRFGGGDRGRSSGGFGGRSSFGSRSGPRFGGGDRGEWKEKFDVICSKCGKNCQVPFKPTGSRPVLCSDCFRGSDSGSHGNSNSSASGISEDQFAQLNAKLDKILRVLEELELDVDEDDEDSEEDEDSDDEVA